MINRRLLGILAGFALLLGIAAPAGAACATGAVAAHSEHHADHSGPASPSHHSSHENGPCGSHDSNCCAAMMSCGSMAMTGRIYLVSTSFARFEPARQFDLFAPATPTLSVEPPPPRA